MPDQCTGLLEGEIDSSLPVSVDIFFHLAFRKGGWYSRKQQMLQYEYPLFLLSVDSISSFEYICDDDPLTS